MQEEPAAPPADERRIAIHRFNGEIEIVHADELRICVPTKECVQFWLTCLGSIICIAMGIFFMIFEGSDSTYFPIGSALLGTGVGGLIPSPNYKEIMPRREHSDRSQNQ